MLSLRVLYDVDGWAYHNRALAMQKYAPPDFAVSTAPFARWYDAPRALGHAPADVILLLPARRAEAVRHRLLELRWPSKLVVAWTMGWPQRLAVFHAALRHADAMVINNRGYWEAAGRLPRMYLVPNGVDPDIFQVSTSLTERRPKVLWVGSEGYRELKGYDAFMVPLRAKLTALGVPCELLLVDSRGRHRRTPAQMAEWYNTGTVLVCASEAEGTPNPALEAAACGCTVVSTPVGNMPDLIRHGVNGYLVERSVEALLDGVLAASANYLRLARAMQEIIPAWHWRHRAAEMFAVLREVWAQPACPPANPLV